MPIRSIEEMTIHGAFEIGLRRDPEKTIQVFEDGRKQTYLETEDRSNRLANGLMSLGLSKGDHVGILAQNCPEYMEFYLAISKAGFVCVPINSWLPPDRISYIIGHSEIKALVFEGDFLPAVSDAAKTHRALRHLIMIGEEQPRDVIAYDEFLKKSTNAGLDVEVKSTDPHMLMYTSGTTGMPKGVLKNMYADMMHPILSNSYFFGVHQQLYYEEGDGAMMCIPPQFHLGGESMTIGTLMSGGMRKLVLVRSFEAEKILKLIHEEKVTTAWILPTMVYAFKQLPKEVLAQYDVSSLKYVICGSTSLPSRDREDMLAFFPNADLGANYACTETAMCAFVPRTVLEQTKPENLGRPSMFCDMMIGDAAAREIPRGETGIIWIKTPGMPMNSEYFKDPEKSAKAFKNGWFTPGDMGYQDEEGYFYYIGRTDDIIMSGGEKVSPLPIEEVVQSHEAVSSCVVVGIPDEKWGEKVVALVVLEKGQALSESELLDYCGGQDKLARFETPKRIFFVDALPTGATGKVLRRSARDTAATLNG